MRGRAVCPKCAAQLRHNKGFDIPSLDDYAEFAERRVDYTSTCAVTGYSLLALEKIGERLSIDRIDPTLGYTKDNMRLIAMSLNIAKGVHKEVPQWAVNRLERKMERTVNDRLSRRGRTRLS